MITVLGIALIVTLVSVETYCGAFIYYYLKWRSAQRTEARRAASRSRIYKEVRRCWAIERNRKDLWSSIQK